jgi:hypothetical protein
VLTTVPTHVAIIVSMIDNDQSCTECELREIVAVVASPSHNHCDLVQYFGPVKVTVNGSD